MMVSEVKRLRPEDIALDADIPHLKIVNDTKTDDRKAYRSHSAGPRAYQKQS